ncbi:unnamed protein product [Hymenolepis diminuta]|uniref:Tetratricopeptide repeat (TPR)-like superfamily protein n=1 Tax=Hymenolepis diminuta TaxID=6216 RepID=A0A0R3SYT7_HYMDI|nr:unnamed protein product [Hymenolepis diminuta]
MFGENASLIEVNAAVQYAYGGIENISPEVALRLYLLAHNLQNKALVDERTKFLRAMACYMLYFMRTCVSYLAGGLRVTTFCNFCPESTDEGQLINREISDPETSSALAPTPKSYNSLE